VKNALFLLYPYVIKYKISTDLRLFSALCTLTQYIRRVIIKEYNVKIYKEIYPPFSMLKESADEYS